MVNADIQSKEQIVYNEFVRHADCSSVLHRAFLVVLTFRYASFVKLRMTFPSTSFDILRQAQNDIAQNDIAQDDTTFFMCLVFCHTEVLEV